MIYLYKNVAHGAFRHGNVGGCLRRNVSVSLAEALALGDVAELAHGRSRLYFRLGSFIEEHLGVLCFYEIFQHFNEPRTRHLCGIPIVHQEDVELLQVFLNECAIIALAGGFESSSFIIASPAIEYSSKLPPRGPRARCRSSGRCCWRCSFASPAARINLNVASAHKPPGISHTSDARGVRALALSHNSIFSVTHIHERIRH